MLIIANNITSRNPEVAQAMKNLDAGYLKELAQRCLKAGADALEINLQHKHDSPAIIQFAVKAIQSVVSIPICLSTNSSETLEAGLKSSKNEVIVNYIAHEEARLQKMLPLAAKYKAQVILFLAAVNPVVQVEEAIRLASILVGACNDSGITNDRIIIDPGLVHITSLEGQHRVQFFRELFPVLVENFEPAVRTTCWAENASTGLPKKLRSAITGVQLAMLAGVGLSSAFLDVLQSETMRTVRLIKIMNGELIYSNRDAEL